MHLFPYPRLSKQVPIEVKLQGRTNLGLVGLTGDVTLYWGLITHHPSDE